MAMFVLCLLLSCNWIIQKSFADTGKIWSNSSGGCGNELNRVILCSEDAIEIQSCYCMYYDQDLNLTIAGSCMFTCSSSSSDHHHTVKRYSIENATSLNQDMCDLVAGFDTHREGRFCGRCKEGYGLAVYSYHYTSCIPCADYGYKNWLRYFAVALLPLTLFYFLVVLLQVNVTSSRLNGVVFIVQCMLSPVQLRVLDASFTWALNQGKITAAGVSCLNVLLSLTGVFNLDFFRTVYPNFCLHSKFNILHVASLDFIVALYPFVLIFLTYLLVTMYDRNCRLVVLAWKPFKWCLRCYQRQFNVKASLVHTFATFILLSNVKILGVCFDLLASCTAYNAAGTKLGRQFLYYDASIEYFSRQHLPFAVLALFIGLVFVFLPFLLLVVYPCGCFQRSLSRLGFGCQALHIFMDAFQGSYRTEPWDLRYFSAYYLLLRFVVLLLLVTIRSAFAISAIALTVIVGTVIFATIQPYKMKSHNKLDIVCLLLMALYYVGYSANMTMGYLDQRGSTAPFYSVPVALLMVMFIGVVLHRKLYVVFTAIVQYLRSGRNPSHSLIETFERE